MDTARSAEAWPHPARYGTAAAAGALWTALWFAPYLFDLAPWPFRLATILILAPSLAWLARTGFDLVGLAALAYVVAVLGAVSFLGGRPDLQASTASGGVELLRRAALEFAPTAVVASLFFAGRRAPATWRGWRRRRQP